MATGSLVAGVNAQTNSGSVVKIGGANSVEQTHQAPNRTYQLPSKHKANSASKTTLGGSRWYNYVEHLAAIDPQVGQNDVLPYMWFRPDMFGIYQGTSGLEADTIQMASYAMTFDPIDHTQQNYNDPFAYGPEIGVNPGTPYTLDSVTVWGVYGRNPNKPNIVDTLRLAFVYGNGGTSNMPNYSLVSSGLKFRGIFFDPAKHIAWKNPMNASAPDVIIRDVILDQASLNDTATNGLNTFRVGVGMNVPANNTVGMTVTFISGESYAPYSDTAFLGSANPNQPFKYGLFRPWFFEQVAGQFQPYDSTKLDYNMGHIRFLPLKGDSWDSLYVVTHAFTSANFSSEIPYIDFKITCATCPTNSVADGKNSNIAKVEAYPNPANTEVYIPFTLTNATEVTVSLSNTVGQILSTQNMGKVSSGKATFSTANLAPGIYFYTVEANGERNTGRIVVAH